MASATLFARASLLLLFTTTAFSADSEECKKWGFTGEAECADCETLNDVLKDAELYDQCKQCCQAVEVEKFEKGIFNHCPLSLRMYPELAKFLNNHADEYPGLSVVEKPNNVPHLKLIRGDGSYEILRVESWNTKTIVEFLDSHLGRAEEWR